MSPNSLYVLRYRQAADSSTGAASKTPTTSTTTTSGGSSSVSGGSGSTSSKKTRADSGCKSARGAAKSRKSNDFFIG